MAMLDLPDDVLLFDSVELHWVMLGWVVII
jgi:hypothetical protein